MRVLAVLLLLAATRLPAQTLDVSGSVALRGVNSTGPRSWRDGGWGRLDAGGDRDHALADAHLGLDWRPSQHFDAHVSGIAHEEGGGVVEAYVDGRAIFGLDELQLRAGLFFLPTSRENRDELWASPYTVTFSALNSWIGEEVRPLGADLEWKHVTRHGHTITSAATAFRGNDTMGTLLAWRGWALGGRVSAYGEVLPLPPLESLQTHFSRQRDDGTQPLGRDLDGRTGYSGRLRYSVPQRASLQYTWVTNRADRALHRGEYAWATEFHLLSASAGSDDGLLAAAEYMTGRTGMGVLPVFAQADFYSGYLLVSLKRGRNRVSARVELFSTDERDFTAAESNEEDGRSWTLAWLFDLRTPLRLAAELTQVVGDRVGTPDPDGRAVTIEARYRF